MGSSLSYSKEVVQENPPSATTTEKDNTILTEKQLNSNELLCAVRDNDDCALRKILTLPIGPEVDVGALLFDVCRLDASNVLRCLFTSYGVDPFRKFHGEPPGPHMPATLLDFAIQFRAIKVCKVLVGEFHMDVNERGVNGTPLGCAARTGNYDVCKYLIDSGADVNGDMKRPIMQAIYSKSATVCQLLIDNGVDVNTKYYDHPTTYFTVFDEPLAGDVITLDVLACLLKTARPETHSRSQLETRGKDVTMFDIWPPSFKKYAIDHGYLNAS
jgi:hypothetical protein